eukprot:CAMPEP_0197472196 /NCGR_PEP_ID=MMETSP1309-20131121/3383_1 /TAXON_ID=464262 /ORGANISM="Genus nov. species nov., Strain RCC998" /LENGTH=317 /DNA_ID=CAMNT_0043010585 /DNA_START=95 /DNA_END=1044 /DNA_ORIENTATION=+
MVLNDVLSRQAVLPGLKARFLIPTSGTTSVSVWDATDIPTLQTWLDETLSEYCTTQCFEAVEEFSHGLSVELARLRVSENVSAQTGKAAATVGEKAQIAITATAAKAKEAGQKVGQRFEELDQKLKIKEKTSQTYSKAKETTIQVGSTTKTALGKVGQAAMQTKDRAMQNKVVAGGVSRIGSGISFMSRALSQLGDTVIKSVQEMDKADPEEGAAIQNEKMLKEALDEAEQQEEEKKEEFFAGFDDDVPEEEPAAAPPVSEPEGKEEPPKEDPVAPAQEQEAKATENESAAPAKEEDEAVPAAVSEEEPAAPSPEEP